MGIKFSAELGAQGICRPGGMGKRLAGKITYTRPHTMLRVIPGLSHNPNYYNYVIV